MKRGVSYFVRSTLDRRKMFPIQGRRTGLAPPIEQTAALVGRHSSSSAAVSDDLRGGLSGPRVSPLRHARHPRTRAKDVRWSGTSDYTERPCRPWSVRVGDRRRGARLQTPRHLGASVVVYRCLSLLPPGRAAVKRLFGRIPQVPGAGRACADLPPGVCRPGPRGRHWDAGRPARDAL